MTQPSPAPTYGQDPAISAPVIANTPDPFGVQPPPPPPPPLTYAAAPPPPEPHDAATAALAQQAATRTAVVARSVDITLTDGRVLGMRYGMAGVAALEEEFGGLGEVAEAFALLQGGKGKVFTAIIGLVGAGLAHHGITKAEVIRHDLLDLNRIMEYGEAAAEAFDRAFPAPADAAGEAPGQPAP